MWNASTGRQTQVFEPNTKNRIAMFPNGSHVINRSSDDAGESSVHVWNVATGKEVTFCTASSDFAAIWKETKLSQLSILIRVAVSPDESHVMTCSRGEPGHYEPVRVWNMTTGMEVALFAGHTNVVNGVAVTPDGVHVVSCSDDKTVRMWKLHTGEETMVFEHTSNVQGVAVTPDGSRVVSRSGNKTLRVWDVGSGKEVFTLDKSGVCGVAFTPDGGHVVCVRNGKGGTVCMWSMTTGEEVAWIRGHGSMCFSIAVSPDGCEVMCGFRDKTVRVWGICTGEDGTVDGLRLKRVIGVPPTVPRELGCNADAVEPELARRIILTSEE